MKYLKLTIYCLLCTTVTAFAQVKMLINSALQNDLQKVVAEYTRNFENIRGEVLNQNPQTVEYLSHIKLKDAEQCSITRYSSGIRPVYSWQALMFTTEDFSAASKKYKWLFNQLKGMNVFYIKDQYTLKGSFEAPDESRKFATSILALNSPPDPLKKLKVEISMLFEFPEWKVNLVVYEKEKEDDERGPTEEE
jgi:hypothetical protein